MAGNIARIALTLHMVRIVLGEAINQDQIDLKTMQSAVVIGRWFANGASQIYPLIGCISENAESRETREVLDVIRELGGSATIRDIGQKRRKYRDADNKENLEKILRSLVSKRILRTETKTTGGRPTEMFFGMEQMERGTKGIKNTENFDLSFRATDIECENTNFQNDPPAVLLKRKQPKKKADQESKKEEPKHEQTSLFD